MKNEPTEKDLQQAGDFLYNEIQKGSLPLEFSKPIAVKCLAEYVLHLEAAGEMKFTDNRHIEEQKTNKCPECNGTGYKNGVVYVGGSDCRTCGATGVV